MEVTWLVVKYNYNVSYGNKNIHRYYVHNRSKYSQNGIFRLANKPNYYQYDIVKHDKYQVVKYNTVYVIKKKHGGAEDKVLYE